MNKTFWNDKVLDLLKDLDLNINMMLRGIFLNFEIKES